MDLTRVFGLFDRTYLAAALSGEKRHLQFLFCLFVGSLDFACLAAAVDPVCTGLLVGFVPEAFFITSDTV